MPDIDCLTRELEAYLSKEQVNKVRRAYYYAEQAHDGQKRRSGESYITHPLAVASILSEMHMDHQGLMAAMLHDVIEDSDIKKEAIIREFGQVVADIVDGVSKLTNIRFENKAQAQAENFQKMSLALAKDIRVILVKLADRMHNMRTLGAMPPYKRRLKAKETLEIYSPIAHRLGMHKMSVEFEELGFVAMYPMRARMLSKAVNSVQGKRKETVTQVVSAIRDLLIQHNISATVKGREKNLYSIYTKMKMQKKSFSEIMDVFGVRIIAKSVDDCYRILGLIHGLYNPFPGRFKDYIAIPKANGYQSLHTTLFGFRALPVEVQIRTSEMEEMANNGIAAHWLYKEKDAALAVSHNLSRDWVKNLLELQKMSTDPLEYIESVKTGLFPDEVYVFTPKGEILKLPHGATAVDFAYAIHTQIGNHCAACRINKRLASLSEPLESGQTVEIITAESAHPAPAWLDFAVSSKARSNIRHYLKLRHQKESIELGRQLLENVLSQMGTPVQGIDRLSDDVVSTLLKKVNFSSRNDLLEELGSGRGVTKVAGCLLQILNEENSKAKTRVEKPEEKMLRVSGKEQSVIAFAACCYPIPDDPITAVIKSGHGITIHRQSCRELSKEKNKNENITGLGWERNSQDMFKSMLNVQITQSRMIFSSLATTIASAGAEIIQFSVMNTDAQTRNAALVLYVRDRLHLARIIRRLRRIPDVLSITRCSSNSTKK